MLYIDNEHIEFGGVPDEVLDDMAFVLFVLADRCFDYTGGTDSFDFVFNTIVEDFYSRVDEVKDKYSFMSADERALFLKKKH